MSKKSWPICWTYLSYEMGWDFLDIQYGVMLLYEQIWTNWFPYDTVCPKSLDPFDEVTSYILDIHIMLCYYINKAEQIDFFIWLPYLMGQDFLNIN